MPSEISHVYILEKQNSSVNYLKANKKTLTLVAAKDRGQLTQTAAMSLVNIGLLKEIMYEGKQHRHFAALLILTSASLALQLVAGMMSLFISNVRHYYSKYNDDPAGACCIHLCGCQCSWKAPEDQCCSSLCPIEITTNTYEEHEMRILQQNAEMHKNAFDAQLDELKTKHEVEHLMVVLDRARSEEQRLRAMGGDPKNDIEEVNRQLKGITEELAAAQERKKALEKALSEAEISRRQSNALVVHAENIERNFVLKKITFWQNGVNYLFYVVLVINAFITGLGLTDSSRA
ncbi:hypothetical protein CAPTEDRAFT_227304 [Capitella teleta]|uniref:Uncharacterized protein n=1 Tax=Capitella teleta TaxID=283909 RepID=R7UMZ4_CAPTE|nr:hypothetical protein CAPTEDRAFT_227304 [Capitella teleta]|eukprot:ELU05317.1 hypothetical protein CAPTEDRAFT_227304 [Capitella teleta]